MVTVTAVTMQPQRSMAQLRCWATGKCVGCLMCSASRPTAQSELDRIECNAVLNLGREWR